MRPPQRLKTLDQRNGESLERRRAHPEVVADVGGAQVHVRHQDGDHGVQVGLWARVASEVAEAEVDLAVVGGVAAGERPEAADSRGVEAVVGGLGSAAELGAKYAVAQACGGRIGEPVRSLKERMCRTHHLRKYICVNILAVNLQPVHT